MAVTVYQPTLLYAQGQLTRNASLAVDGDGRIVAEVPKGARVEKLENRLLIPGFVNAHSHAFQRVIRSRTEFIARGHDADDFWSWREAMYLAAHSLSPEEIYTASLQAFVEMALAGITTVCEFHYLHHQPDGRPYDDAHLLAKQVVRAARDAGLRILLLRVAYGRAGYQVEANPRQKRFIDSSAHAAMTYTNELVDHYSRDEYVKVGVAPHSVRAVPGTWLSDFGKQWRNAPLHMHVSEQPAEIRACLAEYQLRPVELLHEKGLLGPSFTAVHAIHLNEREIDLLGASKSNVCACPSTERNLGDGIIAADALRTAGASLCLGSDSQAHVDLLEEMRQLEGHLRLARLKRNVLDTGDGTANGLGALLLTCATAGGDRASGLSPRRLAPGDVADFVTVDLSHPSLVGCPDAAVLTAVALSASSAAIRDVSVNGTFIVRDGRHALQQKSAEQFTALINKLAS